MVERQTVTLESLCGTRMLDGHGEFVGVRGEYQDSSPRVFVLRLDGQLYAFQEDPSDGYRSMLDCVLTIDAADLPPGSTVMFPPRVVEVRLRTAPLATSMYRQEDRVLYGVDEASSLVVFEVGTENADDYYPSFVSRWDTAGFELEAMP